MMIRRRELITGAAAMAAYSALADGANALTATRRVILFGYNKFPVLGPNARLIAIGDSITAGSLGASFVPYSNSAAGAQYFIPFGGNLGVGGYSTAQMISSELPTALTLNAQICTVMGGVNDLTSGGTFASITGNLRAIYNALHSVRCIPLAVTILPSTGVTGANEITRQQVNAWIVLQTDILSVNMDATAFAANATYMIDGATHPNRFGAQYIAGYVGAVLQKQNSVKSMLYVNPSDWGNQCTLNALAGSGGNMNGNAGVCATGWSVAVNVSGLTIIGSVSTDGGGYNHQTIAVTGTSSGTGVVQFAHSNGMTWLQGQTYDFWANVSLTGCSGAVQGLYFFETSGAGEGGESVGSNGIVGAMRFYPAVAPQGSSGSGSVGYNIYVFVAAGTVAFNVDISRPTLAYHY